MCQTIIRVEEAVGMVLAHDITEIQRGGFKGPAFRKGHKVREADICHLQRLGKRHLYVLKIEEGFMHENDAAIALAEALCGSGLIWNREPREGKITIQAEHAGLFKVDVGALTQINMLGEVMCATRHTNFLVREGETVAAARAIPLVIRSELIDEAVAIARSRNGVLQVKQLKKARTGILITGNEVYTKLIEDQFEPVLRRKMGQIGCTVIGVMFAPDDADHIERAIKQLLAEGAELLLVTGGMSVDPDDVTRQAIAQAGAVEFLYGTPVLPGAMFMASSIGEVQVLGIPACGLYHEATILDLVLPRILAGEKLTRQDVAAMGHGGLCLHCSECRYPVCPFGKSN
ncbi:MAG: molybdopterin-binding protein [Syntrophobacteraceae bacterium]